MSSTTAISRVVIAGAGPAGSAAAALLHGAGAKVTLLDRLTGSAATPAAMRGIVVDTRTEPALRALGAGAIFDDPRRVVTEAADHRLVSRHDLGTLLADGARSRGIDLRLGAEVRSVTEDADGPIRVGVRDATTGARSELEADWFLDATGGRSPLAHDPRFERQVREPRLPDRNAVQRYVTLTARAIEGRPSGWRVGGSFAVNDVVGGALHASRPARFSEPLDVAASAQELLRDFDIPAESVLGRPRAILLRQAIAPNAASGRIALLGDSFATQLPHHQVGVPLALADAQRVAQFVVDMERAPDEATRQLLRAQHERHMQVAHQLHMG